MRRLAVLLAALLAAALVLTACGGDEATDTPSPTATGSPSPTAPPTETGAPAPPTEAEPTTTEQPTGGATSTTAFFVRSGDSGLWVEPAEGELDEPTVAVARAAMEYLVGGEPADPNLESLAGAGVSVLGVDIDGDTLTVDLSEELRANSTGSAGELAFAQQLAHTAAQFDGVERVRLMVGGAEISDLWGHIDWSQPIEPDPFALSPITFTSHEWGEQVGAGDVTVGGEATTFEATLELRLLGPNGDVLEETFATASEGAPGRGTWEHTFFLEGAATWTIEAVEPDPSGGEGRPPFTTTLELRSS
jgi:hypothetical protein